MRELIEAGRAVDRHFTATRMSAGEESRLRECLERELALPTRPHGRTSALAMTGVVVVLVVLWFLGDLGPRETERSGRAHEDTTALAVAPPSSACDTSQYANKVRVVGSCVHRLDDLGVAIETNEAAIFERTPDGVRMHEGQATFDITPRSARAPVMVFVSHGRIEVIGTRFTIEQGPNGGVVDLNEGRIRFRHRDGAIAELMPGDSLRWGESITVDLGRAEAAPKDVHSRDDDHQVQPRQPTEVKVPSPHQDSEVAVPPDPDPWWSGSTPAEELLEDLRDGPTREDADAEGHYERWGSRESKNEELSYEQGVLLDQQGDPERSCRHWRRHLVRYAPGGRYGARARKRARAACGQLAQEEPW
jgi:hypothetical protein